jgi:hypothetical protein
MPSSEGQQTARQTPETNFFSARRRGRLSRVKRRVIHRRWGVTTLTSLFSAGAGRGDCIHANGKAPIAQPGWLETNNKNKTQTYDSPNSTQRRRRLRGVVRQVRQRCDRSRGQPRHQTERPRSGHDGLLRLRRPAGNRPAYRGETWPAEPKTAGRKSCASNTPQCDPSRSRL